MDNVLKVMLVESLKIRLAIQYGFHYSIRS